MSKDLKMTKEQIEQISGGKGERNKYKIPKTRVYLVIDEQQRGQWLEQSEQKRE